MSRTDRRLIAADVRAAVRSADEMMRHVSATWEDLAAIMDRTERLIAASYSSLEATDRHALRRHQV